tara:strand:- start:296 stop:1150 length:855 start_codon:yes stop_codon:yes gene_type:complete
MASTFSDRLKLELQGSGENSGTWGDKTNNNLQVLDAFAGGYLSKSVAGSSDVTLTTANASPTAESSNKVIELTGTLSGNITVFIPAKENNYLFFNNTSGSHTLTIAATGHTANGVAITQGGHAEVYCDGSSDFNVVNVFGSMGTISAKVLNMTGNVSITDSNFLNVGTGTDLQIYHNGTDSFIENNTGELNIQGDNITIRSDTSTETFLTMDVNDGVDIFHDNVKKFETTSAGATVTGALTVTTTVAATNIGNITARNLITTTSTGAPSSGTGSNGDFYLIHDA